MKKTWTKVVVVALSCMMAFVMAACGGGGGSSDAGDGALHIGVIGPFTGGAALYGTAVKNGAELAVKEINEANPDGLQIVMEAQDDEHDAEKSVNAYNKLLDGGMQVLVGPTTSTPATAVAAEAYANRTFMLTPSGSSPDVTAVGDNVFQLCFSDPNQGSASAEYMAANFPDAQVGVIYKNDDNYSTGIFNKFKAEWEAQGKTVVAAETFTEGVTDFSAQINSLKNAGADMVFLPIYYDAASNILTQANKIQRHSQKLIRLHTANCLSSLRLTPMTAYTQSTMLSRRQDSTQAWAWMRSAKVSSVSSPATTLQAASLLKR